MNHFYYVQQCPDSLREWLESPTSLTDKLRNKTGNAELEVLSQGWLESSSRELEFLGIVSGPTMQRDIMMHSGGCSYWFAKTIIPNACYCLDNDFFNRLKSESIQRLIFGEPRVQLVERKSYSIDQSCPEFCWVQNYKNDIQGILWVRLSEFTFLQQETFYLMEILLPELENL